jgi:soluble lytic murein transglycosylase
VRRVGSEHMRRIAFISLLVLVSGWHQSVAAGPTLDDAFFSSPLSASTAPEPLREASAAVDVGNDGRARALLGPWLAANADHALAPRAGFVFAWLEARAGEHGSAATHYEKAGNRIDLLQNHAFWLGAQAAYDAGDYERAIRLCRAIPADHSYGLPSAVLRGRSMLALGQAQASIDVFQSIAKAHPKAGFGRDASLYLGVALEERGRFVEAGRAFHAVTVTDAGTWRERVAREGIKRVEKRLSKVDRAVLRRRTASQRIARAEALNNKHRSEQVLQELGDWFEGKSSPKKGTKAWCDAKNLQGIARRKLRNHTAATRSFEAFLGSCKGHPATLKVLFSAGRSAWTANKDKSALQWFTRVWKEYPNHSYADDAVLYAARIHKGAGRGAAARKLLAFQIKTFPKGDMLPDAHWQLFHHDYAAGRYGKAANYAARVKDPGENSLYTRGRLAYFRGRALEQQRKKGAAVKAFEAVLEQAPMSYYALLSLGRLEKLDGSAYRRAVTRFTDANPTPGELRIEPPDLATDPTFQRGVELLRLGLQGEARREFDRLRRQRAGDDKGLWTLTVLFDRVGAYEHSHDIPRREIDNFGQAWPVGAERQRFLLAYPRPFHADVKRWSKKRGIPEELVYAIMREESGFNPRIQSWAGACGLLQLMVPTAQSISKEAGVAKVGRADLLVSSTNIQLGTQFLSNLMDGYDRHPAVTIAGYNGGFGNVDRWLKKRGKLPLDLWVEEIPYGQTRHYTKRVLTTMWTYRWLYGSADNRILAVSQKLPRPTR